MNPGQFINTWAWRLIRWLLDAPTGSIYPPRALQERIIADLAPEAEQSLKNRSYAQYVAQLPRLKLPTYVLLQVGCALAFLPFLAFAALSHLQLRRKRRALLPSKATRSRAVFMESTNEALPEELLEEFEILRSSGQLELSFRDVRTIAALWLSYPFSPYFVFKIAFKIAIYRHNCEHGRASSIICASEYSFTSSFLTHWCRLNGLEHINVMHGEKLYSMIDSFASFHRFYVWSEFYLNLVRSLHCHADRFIIAWPKTFDVFGEIAKNKPPAKTITHMLQISDEIALKKMASYLRVLSVKGWSVTVRPHPRWAKDANTAKIFSDFNYQDSRKVSMEDALRQTEYVSGSFSTILHQGYLANRRIVLDDLSDPELFAKLQHLDYILLSYRHQLLSELIRE